MHRKYAPDGLVCVSTDMMPDELTSQERIVGFLRKVNATFPNYIFRDSQANADMWTTKYGIEYTPAVLIFDRQGNRVGIPTDAEHEQIEMTIRRLLSEAR